MPGKNFTIPNTDTFWSEFFLCIIRSKVSIKNLATTYIYLFKLPNSFVMHIILLMKDPGNSKSR